MPPLSLLLLSVNPPDRKTSFARQLELLAGAFCRRGVGALAAGGDRETGFDGYDALILLGFPDQLSRAGIGERTPLFLWAQFSRPPDPSALEGWTAVPLTETTRRFLLSAGVKRVAAPIPHGVDLSRFRPLPAAEKIKIREETGLGGRFVVGTVGANSARKRYKTIFESFALFAEKRRDAALVVKTDGTFARDGTDLANLAARSGVTDRTRFIEGELDEDGMARLYNSMDLYLNLSEWEGFCIPVVEAMACGVPVAAQPVQGPGEIVPYGDLLVRGSDVVEEGGTVLSLAKPEKAAGVLLKAASDPLLAAALAAEGRRAAELRYDIADVAGAWVELAGAGKAGL